jgi:sRNA-binding carbon storage regulator CsrA
MGDAGSNPVLCYLLFPIKEVLMLVLARKKLETIEFPALGIKFTILGFRPNGVVKIGIDAPRALQVMRGELISDPPKEAQ